MTEATLLRFRTHRSAVLIFVALLFGCPRPVPFSAEEVARSYPEFFFQALPLTGLHVDYDASGIIFRYSVPQNEGPVWLQRISDSAHANGWKVVHEGQSGEVKSLHLQRIDDPRHRYRDFHSMEIARITSCGSAILIAGIQVDVKEQSGLAVSAAEGHGGRWYQKWFWPLVAKHSAEACGTK